jgi:glucose/arabinose dehydrogenase
MTRHIHGRLVGTALCLSVAAAGCGGASQMSVAETTGPSPRLPPPTHSLIPTVNVVKASPWPEGATPRAAPALDVRAFARGLDHPRWLYVLPNGDVLVAETNAPPRPDDAKGLKGWFFKRYQKQAGGAVPSANRITLLRDTDADGVADVRTAFLTNRNSPFGMALVGNALYVANTDAVVRFPYTDGATTIAAAPVKVVDLPAGSLNHHWTKNIIASRDGTKLYAAVGSNSNVADNGIEKEEGRAAVWEIDLRTGARRVFASGLRNAVGMAWEPESGAVGGGERA